MFVFRSGSTNLPAPVSLQVDDEIIWSADTGRTLDAIMIGEVIAEKKTLSVKWAWLTESQAVLIKNKLCAGFFPITFHDDGGNLTIESYRGTMSKDIAGDLGDGDYWYRSITVDIIQR